ncbi:aminoglycoside 3'-phosphotransferase [Nonomuraea endophytica]|uniref:Kanamycin kinase n=1 Tax=Nonomuraea endophytica TaxID=714136 RepID=A0A7W8EKE3_9ACTN|nr:phosphotransferase [Nonomuraea endophytica]MBB5082526.1 kanamycin kinase [Nonomuraea endophytica]
MLSDKVRQLITYDARLRMVVADHPKLRALVERAAADGAVDHESQRALGVALLALGEYERAAVHLRRAVELAGSPGEVIAARTDLADLYRHDGDLPGSELICRMTLELARAQAPELAALPLLRLGWTLAEQGRPDEARQALAESRELHRRFAGTPELRRQFGQAPDPRQEFGQATEAGREFGQGTEAGREFGEVVEARLFADVDLAGLVVPLPPSVAALLGEEPEWDHDHDGASGSLARAGSYFVRRGPEAVAEHARLVWLRERAGVAGVVAFEGDVLVTADTGVETLAASDDPGAAMGRALRELHAVPVADCPFDGRLDVLLAQARRNVVEGRVDADDFDDDNLGRTPTQVYERLLAERPDQEDLVVAHGDFTPSNVMTNGVLIDLARLGVADRYRDLAIALRDLSGDFGPEAVAAFLSAYGLDAPDEAKLAYYRLIDELF